MLIKIILKSATFLYSLKCFVIGINCIGNDDSIKLIDVVTKVVQIYLIYY